MNDRTFAQMPAAPTAIRKTTLAEQIVDYVRDRIGQGLLEPGQRLTIQGLADELNVSMTPVREAIKTLTAMKLVETGAGRSVVVARPADKEILDIWMVYNRLEALAGEILAQSHDAAQLDALTRLADETSAAVERGDRVAYFHLNQQFHLQLVAFSQNASLIEMHANLNARLYPFRFSGIKSDDGHWKVLAQEHYDIVEAIRAGDAKRVAGLIEYHSRGARALIARRNQKNEMAEGLHVQN